jgi:hypothetical protein
MNIENSHGTAPQTLTPSWMLQHGSQICWKPDEEASPFESETSPESLPVDIWSSSVQLLSGERMFWGESWQPPVMTYVRSNWRAIYHESAQSGVVIAGIGVTSSYANSANSTTTGHIFILPVSNYGWAASGYSVVEPLSTKAEFAVASSEEIRNLADQLKSYSAYPANWDGDGANAPDQEAIDHAISFLNTIPMGVGLPKPMLLASGEPALYWEASGFYAEIGFDRTGRFYAFGERPGRPSVYIDEMPIEEGFPTKLLELMRGRQPQLLVE